MFWPEVKLKLNWAFISWSRFIIDLKHILQPYYLIYTEFLVNIVTTAIEKESQFVNSFKELEMVSFF